MSEDDVRYRFIFDSVSKYAPTDLSWDEFKTSVELAKFCDDATTSMLSCVFTKEGTTLQHQVSDSDENQIVFLKNKAAVLMEDNLNTVVSVTSVTENATQALYQALNKVLQFYQIYRKEGILVSI